MTETYMTARTETLAGKGAAVSIGEKQTAVERALNRLENLCSRMDELTKCQRLHIERLDGTMPRPEVPEGPDGVDPQPYSGQLPLLDQKLGTLAMLVEVGFDNQLRLSRLV